MARKKVPGWVRGGVQSLFGQCPNVGGVKRNGSSLSRCNECRLLKTTVWIIIGLYIICSGSYSHQLLGTRHMNNKYNKTIKDGDTYITLMVIIKLRPEDPGTLRQIVFNLNLCRNLKKLAEMCSCIRGKSITWLCSVRWIEVKSESESNRYM